MQKTNSAALTGGFFMWGRSMLKRFSVAVALLGIATACQAAGTIGYSLSQQLDQYGNPLTGCKLYTIQAGTTSTPQNSYKDTALTLPQPNPMVCDAAGRLPQFFLADGLIKVRLDDKNGVNQVTADNILVIGPSSGGGGGGSIDPTTIAATGDIKASYNNQTITGWVRLNGRTIGSATSGATERANADVQALFQFLWGVDSNLLVSGGRSGSSAADWAANKTIVLPDLRGRVIAGLDDMGNSAAGRLTITYFGALNGATGTGFGSTGGGESQTLTLNQLPTGISTSSASSSSSFALFGSSSQTTCNSSGGGTCGTGTAGLQNGNFVNSTGSSTNTGGAPHPNVQPTLLTTIYIKL